jgi:hypothetical protein
MSIGKRYENHASEDAQEAETLWRTRSALPNTKVEEQENMKGGWNADGTRTGRGEDKGRRKKRRKTMSTHPTHTHTTQSPFRTSLQRRNSPRTALARRSTTPRCYEIWRYDGQGWQDETER